MGEWGFRGNAGRLTPQDLFRTRIPFSRFPVTQRRGRNKSRPVNVAITLVNLLLSIWPSSLAVRFMEKFPVTLGVHNGRVTRVGVTRVRYQPTCYNFDSARGISGKLNCAQLVGLSRGNYCSWGRVSVA